LQPGSSDIGCGGCNLFTAACRPGRNATTHPDGQSNRNHATQPNDDIGAIAYGYLHTDINSDDNSNPYQNENAVLSADCYSTTATTDPQAPPDESTSSSDPAARAPDLDSASGKTVTDKFI